ITSPDNVIDVFKGGKTTKIKQKNWNTLPVYPTEKKVVHDLVQEEIILRKLFEDSKSLSSSIIVIGVVSGTQANANMQT
ncbi:5769_t:CDS:2, partial [Funneliformis geosporum]